jgi:serine/threonine protein kinase
MKDDHLAGADPFGQIADEFVEAFRQGKHPSVEEFARRYPEHADEIREILPTLVLLEKAKSAEVPGDQRRQGQAAAAAAPLRQLGDYQILREVGRGGMGVVYEAEQESLGRHVALKVLPLSAIASPTYLERFRREAKAAGRLHHTNIVPVYGTGEHEGTPYYAMQFIRGEGLDKVLADVRRLRGQPSEAAAVALPVQSSIAQSLLTGQFAIPFSEASDQPREGTAAAPTSARSVSGPEANYYRAVARIGVQAAEALAYAHSQGVLHRDIKPSNLMLDQQGTVWITDFGLAKAEGSEDLTQTGNIVGTLRYMAPERFEGHSLPQSDVYALGLTLYELLTLRPAFDDPNQARLIEKVFTETPLPPRKIDPRIPRDLETVVLKAIAPDRARRYQTAAEMADDLKRFVEDRPVLARRVSTAERLWRLCRRNPVVTGMAAAVVLAMVLGTLLSCLGYLDAKRQETIANQQRQVAEEKEKEAKAYGLVQLALNVDTAKVPPIIEEMADYRQWTEPMLREVSDKSPQRLHASLALLPADPGQVDYLFGQMLDADPRDALPVIREALAPHKDRFLDRLWAVLERPEKGKEPQRLRAAAALAMYDPDSKRWGSNFQVETVVFLSTLQEKNVRVLGG